MAKCLLCVSHCSKHPSGINSLNLNNRPVKWHYYYYYCNFADETTKAVEVKQSAPATELVNDKHRVWHGLAPGPPLVASTCRPVMMPLIMQRFHHYQSSSSFLPLSSVCCHLTGWHQSGWSLVSTFSLHLPGLLRIIKKRPSTMKSWSLTTSEPFVMPRCLATFPQQLWGHQSQSHLLSSTPV